LVNNAGITRDSIMVKMTREKNWDPVIAVNLGSVFNTCNLILPGMNARKWGRIVNISSMNGQRGQIGQANYCASKAGVIGYSRAIALEAARNGVTINVICPGFIKTEMTAAMPPEVLEGAVKQIPLGRIGMPDDIANGVVFLASESAAWITGHTLSINGGQFME
ncbi:MAG TPA: SDR family oxidoreductase, partial [Candidatus Defluviicoccus seviourii]|nr:SDR family oxidoreductase [Candidatus Defluviicoccus seviourii]